MCFIPLALWISNAAARFSGNRGAVSIQARRVGCSRQAIYDQARKVHGAVQAEYSGGPTREELIRENQALRCENAQLWEWVDRAVEFTLAKQQKFSAIASGMGLSLTQVQVLLTLILELGRPLRGPRSGAGSRPLVRRPAGSSSAWMPSVRS